MTSQEWKIHKRLLEAAGDSRNIYICSARGQNKTETERKLIEELQAAGRTVVRMEDLCEARTMSSSVLDYDLLEPWRMERANTVYDAIVKAHKELMTKPQYSPEYGFLAFLSARYDDYHIPTKNMWLKQYPNWVCTYVRKEED